MQAVLVTFGKKGVRKDFPLGNGAVVIGRKTDADLRIPLSEVSRLHCEIILENEEVLLRDLNSSNGTFVNDQKVTRASLNAGDVVKIGPVIFTLQVDGVPSDISPASAKPKAAVSTAPADRPTVAPTSVESVDDSDAFDIDDLSDMDISELSDLDLEEIEDVEEVDLDEIDEVEEVNDGELKS